MSVTEISESLVPICGIPLQSCFSLGLVLAVFVLVVNTIVNMNYWWFSFDVVEIQAYIQVFKGFGKLFEYVGM